MYDFRKDNLKVWRNSYINQTREALLKSTSSYKVKILHFPTGSDRSGFGTAVFRTYPDPVIVLPDSVS
jgi:hypothetical protein